ncbi:MAG: FG-GAP repeat protein [Pseudomonadota bacterium]
MAAHHPPYHPAPRRWGKQHPQRRRIGPYLIAALLLHGCGGGGSGPSQAPAPPPPGPSAGPVLDLSTTPTGNGILRLSGAASTGQFGVPVAAGSDIDGDGAEDYAMSAMLASPLGRTDAGQVHLVLGDGTLLRGDINSAVDADDILIIAGAARQEVTSSEIWMEDVTGDGIGDLIIARQNYREPSSGRIGAGAVSILVGGATVRDLARNNAPLDLAAPPANATVLTLVGAAELDRLGMWMRTGDVTGDGIADVLIGADQEDGNGEPNRGAAWLLRGGVSLAQTLTVDLANFGATPLAGHLLKITPPAGATDYHFGATLTVDTAPGSVTRIDGATVAGAFANLRLGEDMLAGEDYNGDGAADLFLGDIRGDALGRTESGVGHVFFTARNLRDRRFAMDAVPADLTFSTLAEPEAGAIGADTSLHGDFDGDGITDLAVASPLASPSGRFQAGTVHVLWGQPGPWPARIDLAEGRRPAGFAITDILGAFGGTGQSDAGDTLMYSAAPSDLDGDGRVDLVINEMRANAGGRNDVGNLLIVSGARVPRD